MSGELVTLAHGGVTISQCRGERRKLKRFRPTDTLIKLSIFCQETELSLPFTLPATRRRWLKNFAGVTDGFASVDDCVTSLAGCSPNDSLQSTPVPLFPAFMIGGFVLFKVRIFAFFFSHARSFAYQLSPAISRACALFFLFFL